LRHTDASAPAAGRYGGAIPGASSRRYVRNRVPVRRANGGRTGASARASKSILGQLKGRSAIVVPCERYGRCTLIAASSNRIGVSGFAPAWCLVRAVSLLRPKLVRRPERPNEFGPTRVGIALVWQRSHARRAE